MPEFSKKFLNRREPMDGWGKHNLPPTSLSPSLFSDFAQRAIHSSTRSHANLFRRSKVNKPKQFMRTLPHLSLPCPIDDRLIFCSKSTCNRQSRCVIGLSSPSRSSPFLSGQDDPETAQWHVDLYIKKAFVKDVSAPALF
jgi:hypothetical protein